MSLLKIALEKLPPSQKSSLENNDIQRSAFSAGEPGEHNLVTTLNSQLHTEQQRMHVTFTADWA